jgi:hypothetical protein
LEFGQDFIDSVGAMERVLPRLARLVVVIGLLAGAIAAIDFAQSIGAYVDSVATDWGR